MIVPDAVTLPRLRPGSHSVTATYTGSTVLLSSTARSVTLRVRS